ncbi:MAG: hypothetical protein WAU13_11975, partial [Albidovulum sp.]
MLQRFAFDLVHQIKNKTQLFPTHASLGSMVIAIRPNRPGGVILGMSLYGPHQSINFTFAKILPPEASG